MPIEDSLQTEEETLELEDVLDAFTRSVLYSHNFGMPARVVSYDPATQTCEVDPYINGKRRDGSLKNFPPLSDVPVHFPSGGGFAMSFPLEKGDDVWLKFSDRSLDEWITEGNSNITPRSPRRMDYRDAIAEPGIRPLKRVLSSAISDGLVVGSDGTGARMTLKNNGKVRIDNATAELVGELHSLVGQLRQMATFLGSAMVATALGPQPLSVAANMTQIATQLVLIETRLASFKE